MQDSKAFTERSTCKLGEQNFNECVKSSFNENWPSLHNPNKNEKYPLLDPFFFEYADINFNRSKLFKGSFAIKNMTLLGANQLRFTKIESVQNGSMLKVTANAFLSQFVSSGWSRSNILFNEFRYNTKAKFHLTANDVKAKFVVTGDLSDDGSFKIKNIEMTPTVKNMKFNITNADKSASKSIIMQISN